MSGSSLWHGMSIPSTTCVHACTVHGAEFGSRSQCVARAPAKHTPHRPPCPCYSCCVCFVRGQGRAHSPSTRYSCEWCLLPDSAPTLPPLLVLFMGLHPGSAQQTSGLSPHTHLTQLPPPPVHGPVSHKATHPAVGAVHVRHALRALLVVRLERLGT